MRRIARAVLPLAVAVGLHGRGAAQSLDTARIAGTAPAPGIQRVAETGPSGPRPELAAARAGAGRPLTAADLEPFLDGVILGQLARDDIAGAVVAVVRDGELLLAKGYGLADVEAGIPADATATRFRVASITKLFTATAVMQLAERGRLDLDADIARYLDFEVPRRFDEPLTLRHLLTHTGGFEERFKVLGAEPGEVPALRDVLVHSFPGQIHRPGTVSAYSNWGSDLAGYIVGRVSGLGYEAYVRRHILDPLGMTRATFDVPLPGRDVPDMSRGYDVASEPAGAHDPPGGAPSGELAATAEDMARFMIAHLQDGRIGDRRILAEETARAMREPQHTAHPDVGGMALGFWELDRNGYRIVGHGGDLTHFHSQLNLIPSLGVGLFVSYNSSGTHAGARDRLWTRFMERYFPDPQPRPPVLATAAEDAREAAGPYVLSRRPETSMLRALSLALPLNVVANEDGSISIPLLESASGDPARWYEVAPQVWRHEDGSSKIGFVRGDDGRIAGAAVFGGHELQRAGWSRSPGVNLAVVGPALLLIVGTLVAWPVGWALRRRYGCPLALSAGERRRRWAVRGVLVAFVLFLGGYVAVVGAAFGDFSRMDGRLDPWLRLVQLLALVGVGGTAVVLGSAWRAWRTPTVARWERAHASALALACAALVWFILSWNFLSPGLAY